MKGAIIPLLITLVFGSVFFTWMFYNENKYQYSCTQASNGVLVLSSKQYEQDSLMFLIDDWAFYKNKLLTPQDFEKNPPTPDAYLFAGQFNGFNLGEKGSSIYGDATYRLTILTKTYEQKTYMLELPEIFSAYQLWINGQLLYTSGSTSDKEYEPAVANTWVSFTATDRIEILIAVSNYTHYYSGIVYPPALGSVNSVGLMLQVRTFVTYMVCFIAITLGVFFMAVGFMVSARRVYLLYGILCFLFAGSSSYFIVHSLQLRHMLVWYTIEDICSYASLFFIGMVCVYVCRIPVNRIIYAFGAASLLCILAVSTWRLNFLGGDEALLLTYSRCLSTYKLLTLCFLLYTAAVGIKQGLLYSRTLLCGIVFFGISLAADIFAPLFEPAYLLRPTEIGSFVLICVLGAIMLASTISDYRNHAVSLLENAVLHEKSRMAALQLDLLAVQYQNLQDYLSNTERVRHDLRHHLSVMKDYLADKDFDGLTAYLNQYHQSTCLEKRIMFTRHPVINSIVNHYAAAAEKIKADMSVQLALPDILPVSDIDMCIILGNCLENALEACSRQQNTSRFIKLNARHSDSCLNITLENSYDGQLKKRGDSFLSSKRSGEGVGIASVTAIVSRHHGESMFSGKENTFQVLIMLPLDSVIYQ